MLLTFIFIFKSMQIFIQHFRSKMIYMLIFLGAFCIFILII